MAMIIKNLTTMTHLTESFKVAVSLQYASGEREMQDRRSVTASLWAGD